MSFLLKIMKTFLSTKATLLLEGTSMSSKYTVENDFSESQCLQ